ncbi:MAG: hypothetical protein LBB94_06700 [Clostridiales bacterium]|jgi:hypothetical protein|nr:hypothetical protein [Clostridiales bacterium]
MTNFFKKVSAWGLIAIMAVGTLTATVFAKNFHENSRAFNSVYIRNKNNKEIKFNVAVGVSCTEDQLVDIANGNLDGDNFEIYDVVYAQPDIPMTPKFDPIVKTIYTTTKTPTATKALAGDYFVISAAKGQVTTITNGWSKSLSASVTGSYKDYGNLGLNATITKSYTKTDQFSGPPESSGYNSRVYQVKFYYNAGNWTQYYDKYDAFGNLIIAGFVKGTYTEPHSFLAYSYDVAA